MPKGIVHCLEFVDIDCKNGVHGASRHAIKSVVNLAAIGDPRELIRCRRRELATSKHTPPRRAGERRRNPWR